VTRTLLARDFALVEEKLRQFRLIVFGNYRVIDGSAPKNNALAWLNAREVIF